MRTVHARDLKVVHIMSNGEVRDSIEGIVIPEETGFYRVLADVMRKRAERAANSDTAERREA